ncbi:MAG: hypothetical protein KAW56_10100 [Candidatus Marinimicrobia bacterium]|nr:hypothetical protein [Candidatus Neomarinimicrobiota bacterium]
MTIYKSCDGEKIDKCSHCDYDGIKYVYTEIRYKRWCDKQKKIIKNYPEIPSWCPLEEVK